MGTFEEFTSMNVVDMCVKEEKFDTVKSFCPTCEIANCVKSYLYWALYKFWTDYNNQQKINNFLNKTRVPQKKRFNKNFIRCK